MITNLPVLPIICLAALIVRSCCELLKETGNVNPKSIIVFAVIFAVTGLIWISRFNMVPLDSWHLALPGIVKWMAAGLVITGPGLGYISWRGCQIDCGDCRDRQHLVLAETRG
jgi:hypothetical protein